jgi:hypothetical protein
MYTFTFAERRRRRGFIFHCRGAESGTGGRLRNEESNIWI